MTILPIARFDYQQMGIKPDFSSISPCIRPEKTPLST
jgi:hypothetical protein